jgi:Ca2+-binding EF-hand superfamily protein
VQPGGLFTVLLPKTQEAKAAAHSGANSGSDGSPSTAAAVLAANPRPPLSLRRQFDRYDQGRKGYLDIRDLEALMSELGYDSDPNYLQGLKQSFARFDEDGNGTIELAEFQALWTHLGGDERVTGQTEAVVDASDGDDEATVLLRRRFRQYDVNQSGQLSHYEVEMICVDLGYDVDSKYVSGLMQQFAEFDKNHDGSIRYVVCLKNALVENKPLTAATLCIAQLRRVWNAMGIPWW